MREYEKAADAIPVAKECIKRWHKHLKNVKIEYLFTEDLGVKAQKRVLAKVKKTSPTEFHFSGADVFMFIDKAVWFDELSQDQRIALVDHELCHLDWDQEKSAVVMVAHDVEEFAVIIKRHGLWKNDLIAFREQCGQLNLFTDAVDMPAADAADQAPAVH